MSNIQKENSNVYNALFNAKHTIKKIKKDKKGYNFDYNDPLKVISSVNSSLIKHKLLLRMGLYVPENEHTGKLIGRESVVNGKRTQWVSNLLFEFTITHITSGEEIKFIWTGSGVADQPGQADGAAESYALRQFLEKQFDIQYDKDGDGIENFALDSNGLVVERIAQGSLEAITKVITNITNDRDKMLIIAREITNRVNKEVEPINNYRKISELPEEYAQVAIDKANELLKINLESPEKLMELIK